MSFFTSRRSSAGDLPSDASRGTAALTLPALAVGDVTAPVIYTEPAGPRPQVRTSALTGGSPEHLGSFHQRSVAIEDVRQIALWLSLDREGVELHRDSWPELDLYNDRVVETLYYPRVEKLIAEAVGASRVVIFDHTRRMAQGPGSWAAAERKPAVFAHNDYTPLSIAHRVDTVLSTLDAEEAEELRGRDFVQVNHWRPVTGPVVRMPLAMIDAESVDEGDLVPTDMLYPERVGEIYHVAENPEHRWMYVSRMKRDEVLLIKGYDSREDGRARFTPHGAFEHPDTPADAPVRESIEVRTLAFV
jgi:hypothetical protein